MKKIFTLVVALMPVLGFAQTANNTRIQQAPAEKSHITTDVAVALPQQNAAIVLTEEEAHAQWLQNNTHFKAMSTTERNTVVRELEQKLSHNLNTPAAIELQREIKWIKEFETEK